MQEPLFNLLGKILCILPVFKLLKDIFLFSFTSSLPLWAITTLYFLFSIRTPYIASISAHASSTVCTLPLSISSSLRTWTCFTIRFLRSSNHDPIFIQYITCFGIYMRTGWWRPFSRLIHCTKRIFQFLFRSGRFQFWRWCRAAVCIVCIVSTLNSFFLNKSFNNSYILLFLYPFINPKFYLHNPELFTEQ